MNKLSAIALLGLALTACFESDDTAKMDDTYDPGATGDSWVYYPTEIDVVTYSYDSSEWMYSVDIIGWAESVEMYITQDVPNPWEEDHVLENIEYAEDGSWDLWELTLPVTTSWEDQESGVNTLFAGDAAMEATMAWRIDAYEDGAVADCVVWGSDISLVDTGDCREITF
jgi:hypothetical protein